MRYIRRGTSQVHWLADATLTSFADQDAPTVAEIAPATDITTEIQQLNNFSVVTETIEPDGHGTAFIAQLRGKSAVAGTPSIEFFDDSTDVTVQALLAGGLVGYLILMPDGDVTGTGIRCEIWPTQAHGAANDWTVGVTPTAWSTGFAVLERPSVEAVST